MVVNCDTYVYLWIHSGMESVTSHLQNHKLLKYYDRSCFIHNTHNYFYLVLLSVSKKIVNYLTDYIEIIKTHDVQNT